ncbi:hypothetical protein QP157_00925 [Sphingomonas sp. LR61]
MQGGVGQRLLHRPVGGELRERADAVGERLHSALVVTSEHVEADVAAEPGTLDQVDDAGDRLDRTFGGDVLAQEPDQAAQVVEDGGALLPHLTGTLVRALRVAVDLPVDHGGHQGDAGQVVGGDVVELAGHGGPFTGDRGVDQGVLLAEDRARLGSAGGADLAAGPHQQGDQEREPDGADGLQDALAECAGQDRAARRHQRAGDQQGRPQACERDAEGGEDHGDDHRQGGETEQVERLRSERGEQHRQRGHRDEHGPWCPTGGEQGGGLDQQADRQDGPRGGERSRHPQGQGGAVRLEGVERRQADQQAEGHDGRAERDEHVDAAVAGARVAVARRARARVSGGHRVILRGGCGRGPGRRSAARGEPGRSPGGRGSRRGAPRRRRSR